MNHLHILSLMVIIYLKTLTAFNISPVSNYDFREPVLPTGLAKTGTSLFGFSVTLRQSSIIIGAPKAQSSLFSQSNINETGAIYKCAFSDKTCKPFVFDQNGNYIDNSLNSKIKDNQLLGYAVDGLGLDDTKLVVCAPQIKAKQNNEYYLHGICYHTSNTNTNEPNASPISALNDQNLQQQKRDNNTSAYYYWLGEMGFSVHVNDDNTEILMGAPGINNWKGSVVHFKQGTNSSTSGSAGEVGPSDNQYQITEVDSSQAGIDDDSYLGYAISSGYFLSKNPKHLFYIASAPQADQQSGRVYIFSIDTSKINIHKHFDSSHMGEYFGYSILVEDFNNDQLSDIAIGAPLYSKTGYEDNGAVYIYHNHDDWSFEYNRVTSDSETSGRFGTSLGKIGDINRDGYNDLAIGAPFEDDGAVYIYLGSSSGLNIRRHSQKITPSKSQVVSNNFMFGHSISRGVDIDQNEYNDIAIGAPQGERVFVYRTYPVGKIESTLKVDKKELKENDRNVKVTGCWWVKSVTQVRQNLGMTVTLKADNSNNRAKWQENNNKIFETNVTVNSQSRCTEFDLLIEYNPGLVFRPIDIEMEYVVHEQPTNTAEFCSSCVKIDTNEVSYKKETIIYNTGCVGKVCIADLTIKSTFLDLKPPFILGSSNSMSVRYDVKNLGEPAYLPQINITLENNVASFSRIPSSCKIMDIEERELNCDLTQGNPIKTNEQQSLTVSIDTTRLEGDDFSISAKVFSSGEERNEADNKIIDRIELDEFSHVEITGKSTMEFLSIAKIEEPEVNIIHRFEIINHGPSNVKDMIVQIFVPTKYLAKEKRNSIQIIDTKELSLNGIYTGQYLQWSRFSDAMPAIADKGRFRRDTRKIKSSLDELPSDRTINFFCDDNGYEENLCVNSLANVKNFRKGNEPIVVSLNFTLKIKSFESIFSDTKDNFVIKTFANVKKPPREKQSSITVDAHQPYTVVSKTVKGSTPIWIIVVSVLAGIIILALITFGLYKMNFFKRKRVADRMNLVKDGEEMELRGTTSDNE